MDTRVDYGIPLLEQVKIQAQALVPLLRAFRAELGEERANRIAWQALAEWRREVARTLGARFTGSPRERWQAATQASLPAILGSVEVKMLKQEEQAVEFDVVGCQFAQFFRELGEPDLGFALTCAFDDTNAEEIGKDEVAFSRTGTIMRGAERCDFRYALKKTAGG